MLRFLSLVFATVAFSGWAQAQSTPDEMVDSIVESILNATPSEPTTVGIGVKVTQITDVDQQAENFTVVARSRMVWNDPKLTVDPQTHPSGIRVMSPEDFVKFTRENDLVAPVAIYENLQKRSFIKSGTVGWDRNGNAFYADESVLTLQAPDFDFRKYPFDTQKFFIRIVMNAPNEFFQLEDFEDFSGLGEVLGEEEWVVQDVWTEIDTAESIAGWQASRFSLGISADRHMVYYWMRIFLPILLLSIISWANLFLEEYRRRIDIAGANLLAFIAFSFTISGDLPKLGYVTFLDALLMSMFLLSATSVAYNVMLRKLSVMERDARAKAIDWHVTFWGYPTLNVLIVVILWIAFFT